MHGMELNIMFATEIVINSIQVWTSICMLLWDAIVIASLCVNGRLLWY